ncbi:3-hydroxyacyl-CoA dehydrogenase NAD-binding domain-containing protein [Siccirubricoccus deserti]
MPARKNPACRWGPSAGRARGPPPDLLIESIPEEMALKQEFLARIEAAWGGRCLLASNTSVLPLQALADPLRHPERFCGLHYMQPADTFAYVELIAVRQSAPETLEAIAALLARCGRTALRLSKPIPGALINRLQHAMANEAYQMIAEGAVDAATVDLVIRRMLTPRMAVTGLIEQKDLSGLGTHAASQSGLVPLLHHEGTAAEWMLDLPKRDETGADAGLGFYDWRDRDPAAYRAFAAQYVARMLALQAEAEAARAAVAPALRQHPVR